MQVKSSLQRSFSYMYCLKLNSGPFFLDNFSSEWGLHILMPFRRISLKSSSISELSSSYYCPYCCAFFPKVLKKVRIVDICYFWLEIFMKASSSCWVSSAIRFLVDFYFFRQYLPTSIKIYLRWLSAASCCSSIILSYFFNFFRNRTFS